MEFMLKLFNQLRYISAGLLVGLIFGATGIAGQTPTGSPAPLAAPSVSPAPTASPTPAPTSAAASSSPERQFLKNIVHDQKAIWTSPFHLHREDVRWLLPFGAGVVGLIATDRYTSGWVDRTGSLPAASRDVSYGGAVYSTFGTALGFYAVGRITGNRRARETGLLATEALIDSGIVTQALKFTAERWRPNDGNGHGSFFRGGSSFPSGHATSIWTLATVISNEYKDKPLIKYGAYGVAILVSLSRYSGRNHYLSDLLVGSAIGYGIGRFVYVTHHDKTLDAGTEITLNRRPPRYIPQIIPSFDGRTRTYGVGLIWHL